MKNANLAIIALVAICLSSVSSCGDYTNKSNARHVELNKMVNVSEDYYLDINNGNIDGIYYEPKKTGDMSPWTGCSSPVKEKVSIISVAPDERTAETFKVKDSKGYVETYEIADIYDDIPNVYRGYIPLLIREGGEIQLTSRACGSGMFPSFVSATR